MIMKKIVCLTLAFAALLLLPRAAYAEEEGTIEVSYLVVVGSGGSQTELALGDNPMLSFKNDSVVVTCNSKEIMFNLSEVTDYHFITKKVTTGINHTPSLPDATAEPTFTPDDATFSGLKAGTRILVFTTNGQLVTTIQAAEDGTAKVNLSHLPRGIYILRAPGKSFKILNR